MTSRNGSSHVHVRRTRLLRIIVGAIAFPAALFLPAGRLNWMEAWAFLVFFFVSLVAMRAWMLRHNPALVAERFSMAANVEGWDKAVMAIHPVLLFGMLIVAALDAGRFEWSSTPLALRILGWTGLAGALAIVWWVMAVNPFASRWVRIQRDRCHEVITVGPYKYVRHPMYVGAILFAASAPLALGSWWGVIPGAAIAILFIVRTALEDRTLTAKLPGYRGYASRVRARLLPGVW